MEIIKRGNVEKKYHFECTRCGCEYVAKVREMQYDFVAKCPTCGHTNEADMECIEEEGGAL